MNVRLLALVGAVAGIAFGSAASAQTWNAPPVSYAQYERNDRASDRNIREVRNHIQGLIDQLARDQHDYSGHRVAAISDLQAARAQIDAALRSDRGH